MYKHKLVGDDHLLSPKFPRLNITASLPIWKIAAKKLPREGVSADLILGLPGQGYIEIRSNFRIGRTTHSNSQVRRRRQSENGERNVMTYGRFNHGFLQCHVSLNEVSKPLPFENVLLESAPSDAPLRMRAAGFHFTFHQLQKEYMRGQRSQCPDDHVVLTLQCSLLSNSRRVHRIRR